MGILLNPELERRIALKVESGEFRSANEVIERSLDLLEKHDATKGSSASEQEIPIWEVAKRMARELSDADIASVPPDLSMNLDHYLYGAPRVSE